MNRMSIGGLTPLLFLVLHSVVVVDAAQTSKLQILIPQELSKPGDGYDHRDALFGTPPYGGSIQQQVFYAASSLCGPEIDTKGGYPERDGKPWQTPFILLVDRGDCSFVQKVRNAQRAGASGVLIADDTCLCDHAECKLNEGEICEPQEPLMADDGSGADISIPSFLVFKEDAVKIIDVLKKNQHVRAQMSFKVPAANNKVEYDLWTSASDPVSRPIEKTWEIAAVALKDHASFTPHLYIYDGKRAGCQMDGQNQCFTLCTNNGLYCSTDPDGDLEAGASGADVVVEALRRICIWKKYGEKDGIGKEWWLYVKYFIDNCDSSDPTNPEAPTKFNDPSCINAAMTAAGLDLSSVQSCMQTSGEVSANSSATNTFLEHEISDQASSGVVLIPSLVVNGAVVRGSLSFATVLKAVCAGFATGTEPQVCSTCANCHDEFQCVHDGECTTGTTVTNINTGVPTHIFAVAMVVLTIAFGAAMIFQYRRQQLFMRDQVRGIVQEYMPVSSQNTRLGGDTSVGIPEDDEDENNERNPHNGSSSFSIT